MGRPPKNSSLVNGVSDRATTRPRTADREAESEADSDEDAGRSGLGTEMDALYRAQQVEQKGLLAHMPEWQKTQYGQWHQFKLNKSDVRKLVNQTLSQSVPANVVNTVSSYVKIFAGMVVEGAREVQGEWILAGEVEERGEKRRKREGKGREKQDGGEKVVGDRKEVQGSDDTQADSECTIQEPRGDGKEDVLETAQGLGREIDDLDRGPMLPDHLREALRRYKMSRAGGSVGFTGLSLEGREVAAPRMGGKRLFR